MVEISNADAKNILQFMSRVELRGTEAPTFVALVADIDRQVQVEEVEVDVNDSGNNE